jgi:hypothetical protein
MGRKARFSLVRKNSFPFLKPSHRLRGRFTGGLVEV